MSESSDLQIQIRSRLADCLAAMDQLTTTAKPAELESLVRIQEWLVRQIMKDQPTASDSRVVGYTALYGDCTTGRCASLEVLKNACQYGNTAPDYYCQLVEVE